MTERKLAPPPLPAKLIETVARDYPGSEIRVSFPEQWQLIDRFIRDDTPLYVAGMPPSQAELRGHHFYSLPPDINRSLTSYRLYKLFEPWPSQRFQIAWNSDTAEGRLLGYDRPQLQLRPKGQAQVWVGNTYGVLWESYLFESERQQTDWPETWRQFWQAVENDMGVQTIFTGTHEPAFPGDYPRFLRHLGYAPDPSFERWWRKDR